jgi:Ca-activated chloride channel homolog
MRRRSELLVGVLMVVGAMFSSAHAQDSFSHTTGPLLRQMPEGWPQIGFDVTVTDGQGGPTASLTSQQMDVREDGRAVSAFDLMPSGDEPQSICILVDTSGSTYSNRDVIWRSLMKLINDLPAKDEVCLIDFSAVAYVDSDLTMDRNKLRDGVKYLKVSGGSAIDDSLTAAAKYLMKNARFRSRAIILLSDGVDNASNGSEGPLAKTLHAWGAPVVYAIDNQTPGPRGPAERHSGRSLQKLTGDTGGLAWSPKGDTEVDAAVTNLVQTMNHRYRLILTTASARDGSEHRLDVTLNKDLRKQKMSINATRGFDAPLPE